MDLIPKIELHCHLDGSLRKKTVLELIEKEGININGYNLERIEDELIAPIDCDSLETYLKKFELPIKILQTSENLERVAFEIMEDAALENVKYIEIRFAPQLHNKNGMSYEEIIGSVIKGIKKAEKSYQIKGNVILSYLRNTSEEGFFEVINAGKNFLADKVVAVDLCGSEKYGFCKDFIKSMSYAKSLGYNITIHAGETGIAENIEEAVMILGATRIGHGIAMFNNNQILDLVRQKNVFIECCPTSNIQTKAVSDIRLHPIDFYIKNGIGITINTDNRTVSDTNMTKEYNLTKNEFFWNKEEYKKIYDYSIDASFADLNTKIWLSKFKI